MNMTVDKDVATLLETVKAGVRETSADPRVGWAWLEADYRASEARAFYGKGGALTVGDEALPALEEAVGRLLSDQRVRSVWREEDLWTTVLSLLAAGCEDDSIDLEPAVRKLVKPAPVRISVALANVTWTSEPRSIGGIMFARINSPEDAALVANQLSLDGRGARSFVDHARQLLREFGDFVAATATSPLQGELAYEDFTRKLDDLVGLVLLFSNRLDDHGLNSLRGATNRPGIRGVALDRKALGELLAEKGAGELAARVFTMTGWGAGNSFRWLSVDPMPLDRLLDADLLAQLDDLLVAEDAIAQRLRVTARWYARAFWADAHDDSALAVSVALDSLLTGKDAVPGAVSKGRFALLERDPAERAARFDRYEQVYKVRSAIAHGGEATRSLAKVGGARAILADARWVAEQLLALRRISMPKDDAAFRELWSAVQWGTVPWVEPWAGT